MANSVDPDETPCSAASHLGLYCLLRPVCPNIYGKYGSLVTMTETVPLDMCTKQRIRSAGVTAQTDQSLHRLVFG